MIQIGCNYSKELIDLLREEAINVDWIKLANENRYNDQFKAIDGIRPILFHLAPSALSDSCLKGWDIKRVNQSILECKSPHVGAHFRGSLDIHLDRAKLKQYVVEKIDEWKKAVECEYLIENMALNRLPVEQHILTDPNFIKDICEDSEIGLLLDLSHLKVSAYYLGMTENEYLNHLPLEKVKEIHINGPRKTSSEYYDAHEFMREEDYTFLEEVLKVTQPRIITLEYGGDEEKVTSKEALIMQINRIRQIINNVL